VTLILEVFGNHVRNIKRLIAIQSRVAFRIIMDCQILDALIDTLCHLLVRHLQMNPARDGTHCPMNPEKRLELRRNGMDITRLDSIARGNPIAVHRVADPQDHHTLVL